MSLETGCDEMCDQHSIGEVIFGFFKGAFSLWCPRYRCLALDVATQKIVKRGLCLRRVLKADSVKVYHTDKLSETLGGG